MKYLLKNAKIYENGAMLTKDMLLDGADLFAFSAMTEDTEIIENCVIFPGFCDVHVHLREPGFSYKETMESGTLACARGGYTTVFAMPNLNPTPDSRENLEKELEAIERGAKIKVYPYGTISVGERGEELSDLEGMADDVIAFSDDGRGVQSEALMLEAMKRAKALGKIIVAHCEDNSLLHGGYIHDGDYAKAHGHRGISSASEYVPIERDIELLKKCGASYHVCHVSAKESVEAIRRAKASGVDITCETAPHYLTLDDSCLLEDGRFKMNPPLRSKEDREALVKGILDGTVDMIATDHAPHSKEEKSRGLEKSLMGVVGIETAFSVLYTYLIRPGIVPMETLAKCLTDNPKKRFGLPEDKSFTVFKLDECYKVDPEEFLSMGRSTPYEGCELYARCLITSLDGKAVYKNEKILR